MEVRSIVGSAWALLNYLEFDAAREILLKLDHMVERIGNREFVELLDSTGRS